MNRALRSWVGRGALGHGRAFGAVLGVVVLGLVSCGDPRVSSEGSTVAGAEAEVLSAGEGSGSLLDIGAGSGLGDATIASGVVEDVAWRLFVIGTEIEYMAEMLCFEAKMGAFPVSPACSGSLEGVFEEAVPVLGFPGVTRGEPRFVYGSLGDGVSRAVVELDSGGPVEAEVVGEARAHYVARLPSGSWPVEVVAYGPDGEELGRRGFFDDEFESERVETLEQSCGETERGYECRERGTVSGIVSGSGEVEE